MWKRIEDAVHALFAAAIFAAITIFAVAFIWLVRQR